MLPRSIANKYSVTIGFLVLFLVAFALFVSTNHSIKKVSAQSCPSELTSTITTTVTLTPSSADNVIDCTGVDVTVANGGKLIIQSARIGDSDFTNDKGVLLKVNNLNIQSGGSVDATGQGYPAGSTETPGNVANALGATSGSGGGHGGAGGEGLSDGTNPVVNPGSAFGALEGPVELGGAGGLSGDGGLGGAGGGAIHIQATGTVTITGQITANGQDGQKSSNGLSAGGGGAGGSVWIEAGSFAGGGSVVAAGGGSDPGAVRVGGGGGGGRIVMLCSTSTTFSGSLNVTGGITSAQSGQSGTKIGVACKPAVPTKVHVYEKDTGTELSVGSFTRDRNIRIAADMVVQGSPGAQVKLQVEIREAAQSFNGTYTNVAPSFSTSPLNCNTPPSDCGLIDINNLAVDKDYKIRVRVVNPANVFSDWADFGANGDGADISTIGDPATMLKISGDNQVAQVNQALSQPFTVKITDPSGYPLSDVTVVWAITQGGGTMSQTYTTTDASGLTSSTLTVGTQSGTSNNQVHAYYYYNGAIGTTFTATATPGPAVRYTVTAPAVVLINQNFNISVIAYDQYNNFANVTEDVDLRPVLNDGVTPASGTLTPATMTLTNGTGQITNAQYSYEQTIKIKIQDASLKTGLSTNVSVVSTVGTCPNRDIDQPTEWKAIDVPGGIYDCRGGTLFIRNGGNLTLTSYDNGDGTYTNDFGVTILADNIVVETLGTINANGKGFYGGHGPGGNAHGGYGSGNSGVLYGNVYHPDELGSGGSYPGGGSVHLIVNNTLQNDGIIEANGGDIQSNWTSAGAGGSIWVDTNVLSGNGTLRADGGTSCNNVQYNGGGGRVAIYYNSASGSMISSAGTLAPQVYAYGGVCGSVGGPGTVYIEQKGVDVAGQARLYMDNRGYDSSSGGLIAKEDPNDRVYQFSEIHLRNYGHFVVLGNNTILKVTNGGSLIGDATKPRVEVEGTLEGPSNLQLNGINAYIKGELNLGGDTSQSDLTIGTAINTELTLFAHTWAHNKDNYYRFKNIDVGANGKLTLMGYDNADGVYDNDYGVRIDAQNITVEAGGIMTSYGGGYQSGRGPGGNAHGGYASDGGVLYGNVYQPDELGSSGSYPGGGAIHLIVSDTLRDDGIIAANGQDISSNWTSAGAGGSVWIETNNLNGTGHVSADGGTSCNNVQYNGGGGRVAVYYTNANGTIASSVPTATPHVTAYGGVCGSVGGAGTVYMEHRGVDVPGKAYLYMDNRGYDSSSGGLTAKTDPNDRSYEFQAIYVKNYGHFIVLGNNTILKIANNNIIVGDATKPRVEVQGTFEGPTPLLINGYTLLVSGELNLGGNTSQSDITIGNSQVGAMTLNAKTWAHDKENYYHFKSIDVSQNGILNLNSYDTGDGVYSDDFGVRIDAQNITVHAGGLISGNAAGYQGGRGPGGNAHGGFASGHGGTLYGNVYQPDELGSSGSYPGGGAIHFVISGTLQNNGIISANGSPVYSNWTSAGAGGSLWIDTNNLAGDGTFSADGGSSCNNVQYNAGGGRVAVYYTNGSGQTISSIASAAPRITAFGGVCGSVGGPGTVYVEQKGVDPAGKAKLYIDNRGYNGDVGGLISKDDPNDRTYQFEAVYVKNYGNFVVLGNSTVFKLTDSNAIIGDATKPTVEVDGTFEAPSPLQINSYTLTINGDMNLGGNTSQSDIVIGNVSTGAMRLFAKTWAHDKDNYYHLKNLTIGSQGLLELNSYDSGDGIYTNDFGVRIDAENITVAAGGFIDASSRGYQGGRGPGGNAHGGFASGHGGTLYGNVYQPDELGSAGSYPGGGAIHFVVSNTFQNDGVISANGSPIYSNWTSAGAGGSVWIDTNNFNGDGTVSADGGSSCNNVQYNAGGGRVAVYYNTANGQMINTIATNPKISAFGGVCGSVGGPGTVYIEQKGIDPAGKAKLYINNRGYNGDFGGLVAKEDPNDRTYEFQQIYTKNFGNFIVLGDNTILKLSTNNGIIGDATKPKVEVDGTLSAPASFQINGIDFTIKGDLDLGGDTSQSDITIGNSLAAGLTLYAHTWAHDKNNYYHFKNITVDSNGLLTLISNDDGDAVFTNDYGIRLDVQNLTVNTGGYVSADGLGYAPGRGLGAYGSHGGNSRVNNSTYGDIYQPIELGSGGSNAWGGGAIELHISNNLQNDGIISANGGDTGSSWNSAGAGGSILVFTNMLNGNGIIRANGGNSYNNVQYNGGGGRLGVYYNDGTGALIDSINNVTLQDNPTPHVTAYGGMYGAPGGPGTVYIEHTGVDVSRRGTLLIDNNGSSGQGMTFDAGIWSFKDVYIGKNITVDIKGNAVTESGVLFDLTGNFVLQTGAKINGVGAGFPAGTGPGNGHNGTGNTGGGGGGHGGNGGTGDTDGLSPAPLGGNKYGAQYNPLTLGSGGGFSGTGDAGGAGGGSLSIYTKQGNTKILGTIDMSGANGLTASPGGGGGAGGSILIYSNTCTISGNLLANGGNGGDDVYQDGGGGGGGRISILYLGSACSISLLPSVAAGNGATTQPAQVGTYVAPITVPLAPGFTQQLEVK